MRKNILSLLALIIFFSFSFISISDKANAWSAIVADHNGVVGYSYNWSTKRQAINFAKNLCLSRGGYVCDIVTWVPQNNWYFAAVTCEGVVMTAASPRGHSRAWELALMKHGTDLKALENEESECGVVASFP